MPNLDIVKFYTESVDLDTTSDTDVYVVPKNHSAVVKNFFISNNTSGNSNYTLKFFHKDDNATHTLLSVHAVIGKEFETIFDDGKPFYMHEEDKLIVAAAVADELVVTICVEEFYDPNR